jgi:DNA repair protein RadD
MELRDYQATLTDRARERLRKRVRRLLLVAATGAGKTVIAAYIQGRAAERGLVTWFVVHRIEIILRTAETFRELGIDFGVVADGFPLEPEKPVQICSVDTLVNKIALLPTPDGIVFDEAHHIVAGNHSIVAGSAPEAWHILITATPERLDGAGLAPFADEMIVGPGSGELMKRGFLSPYRYFAPGKPDLLGASMTTLAEAMGTAKLVGDAVEHWHRDALGLRTIGFEMNRAASQASVAAFRAAGVEAWHVDGSMHRDQRRELFTAFRAGEITYLSQVAIAGEGVDIPGAECALLRYKTNSLTKWMQDVGRVFRPVYTPGFDAGAATDDERLASIAAGPKPTSIILDMGGNAFDFGMPCDERSWSLLGAKERRKVERIRDTIPIRTCPECYQVSASTVKVCPCGYEHSTVFVLPQAAEGALFELGKLGRDQRKAAEAAEKEATRKREKDEERGASLAVLMRLARERNAITPGRYKDPKKWALMKIGLREQYKGGGRSRFAASR